MTLRNPQFPKKVENQSKPQRNPPPPARKSHSSAPNVANAPQLNAGKCPSSDQDKNKRASDQHTLNEQTQLSSAVAGSDTQTLRTGVANLTPTHAEMVYHC